MLTGYRQPLYILPFDHRHSYESDVFHFKEPLTAEQTAEVAHSKAAIYDGFKAALAAGVPVERAGLLTDEEFGAAILLDARKRGYITAMPMEKSGQDEFDFQCGDDYPAHIQKFDPTFVKVLVRYNADGDAGMNARQSKRLASLSAYVKQHHRLFMFELLVPAEKAQLAAVGGDKSAYDQQLRPALMVRAIQELQAAGVEPDVWKIEGLDKKEDCQRIVAAAQGGGRESVGLIVLGRGENEKKVLEWLTTAASVPGFVGFAVGRSTFLQTVMDLQTKKIDRETAVKQIAAKYQEWVAAFEKAQAAAGITAVAS